MFHTKCRLCPLSGGDVSRNTIPRIRWKYWTKKKLAESTLQERHKWDKKKKADFMHSKPHAPNFNDMTPPNCNWISLHFNKTEYNSVREIKRQWSMPIKTRATNEWSFIIRSIFLQIKFHSKLNGKFHIQSENKRNKKFRNWNNSNTNKMSFQMHLYCFLVNKIQLEWQRWKNAVYSIRYSSVVPFLFAFDVTV